MARQATFTFEDWGLTSLSGQIPFIIGLSPRKKFDNITDPVTFRDELDCMHQLLFNEALEILVVDDSSGEEVVGKRVVTSKESVIVPLIAHILSGFLGLVVVCLSGVFLVSYNRQNNLASDPDILGTKMALVAHSELLKDFNTTDVYPAPDVCMDPRKYKLVAWGGGGRYRLDVVGSSDNVMAQNPHALCTVHYSKLVRPIQLSIWTGLAAALVNIALLTLLLVLKKSALQCNGRTQ